MEGPSVILPVYRNAEILPLLRQKLHEVLHAQYPGYELVFVHDASPDNALALLQKMQRQDPEHITIIENEQNLGQQRSVLKGLLAARHATKVVMDADLQDAPAQVPALLGLLAERSGAVFLLREEQYQGLARMISSRIFKLPLYWLSGLHYRAGMFFVMDGVTSEKVLRLHPETPYLTVMVACSGAPLHYLPGTRDKRPMGKSSYSFKGRVKAGINALRCWWQCRK